MDSMDGDRFHSDWLIGKWQVIEQGIYEDSIAPVDPDDPWFYLTLPVHEFQSDGSFRYVNGINDVNEDFARNYFTKDSLLFRYNPSVTSREEIEENPLIASVHTFTFYGRDTLKIVPFGNVFLVLRPQCFKYKRIE
jgi:hypothetical protein